MLRILLFLLILPKLVFADNTVLTSLGSIFDQITDNFGATAMNWKTPMQTMALQLFALFWFPETFWSIVKKAIQFNAMDMASFLFLRVLSGGFYLYFVRHPELFMAIIRYFVAAGSKASNTSITIDGGNFSFGIKPSSIMNEFNNFAQALKAQNEKWLNGLSFLMSIFVGLQTLIVMFCLIVISLMLTISEIETYIVAIGAIGLIGFIGSNWTMGYFQSYLKFVIAMGVKLMFMLLVLGFFYKTISDTSASIGACATASCDAGIFANKVVIALINYVVVTYMIYHVPSLASSALSGSISMGFAGVGAAAAGVGAAMKSPITAAGAAVDSVKAGAIATAGAANMTKAGFSVAKWGLDKISGKGGNSTTLGDSNSGSASGGGLKQAMGHAKKGMENFGSAKRLNKNAFGKMANTAQKISPSGRFAGGHVDGGRGPNL